MGKMKDLALCIDEIMEKIEESLDGYNEIDKMIIYNTLSTKCMHEAMQIGYGRIWTEKGEQK